MRLRMEIDEWDLHWLLLILVVGCCHHIYSPGLSGTVHMPDIKKEIESSKLCSQRPEPWPTPRKKRQPTASLLVLAAASRLLLWGRPSSAGTALLTSVISSAIPILGGPGSQTHILVSLALDTLGVIARVPSYIPGREADRTSSRMRLRRSQSPVQFFLRPQPVVDADVGAVGGDMAIPGQRCKTVRSAL